MNQKEKLAHYKKKAEEFRDLFFAQHEEIQKLKSALTDISVGLASVTTKDNGWGHQTRLQYDAATALRNHKHVHEPKGNFYV